MTTTITRLAIHTDCPILPLSRMFGDTAAIEIAQSMQGGPDCFGGWREPQVPGLGCRPHHILTGMDDEETRWVAKTLIMLGHQVVVTRPDLFTEPTGDHSVAEDMPQRYLMDHGH